MTRDEAMTAERLDDAGYRRESVGATPVRLVAETADFSAFFATSRDRVARALSVALGNVDLGTEAADEAFARAYQRWAKVGGLDNPSGWVYRVGLNWGRSVLRGRRLRQRKPLFDPTSVDQPAVGEPSVMAAIGTLDDAQRAVVVCRHLLDLSVEETADALGIRPGTVKSRLHRAHQILRSHLGHLEHDA